MQRIAHIVMLIFFRQRTARFLRFIGGLTASHLREPFFMKASKKAWHGQAFYYAESPFTFFARFDL
ncbi:hypothetical protein CHCC15337_2054 [Bacillus paralicheniformis]|nr:hypothetical protein CHCC5021_0654 [Bacillus paralicheniformis]TWL04077.1 hypothetical protein CHCC19468_0935 [Bacillus paralicheniformis]TWL09976.1 hypothetical protein CHCC19467_2248 [Bacillus paralicheniformis]TWL46463.1 hypothetical protein CHCC15337_2054 [Bacillus paralicheniformis]TWL47623.1 hypothetical protein CHCC15332_1809 [Bacillus paralicheniformis]